MDIRTHLKIFNIRRRIRTYEYAQIRLCMTLWYLCKNKLIFELNASNNKYLSCVLFLKVAYAPMKVTIILF